MESSTLQTSYGKREAAAETFDRIIPHRDERAVLVGTTGSGKTTLARAILARFPHVVILDPKGLIEWNGYRKVTTLSELLEKQDEPRLSYAPIHDELIDPETIEKFFQFVYLAGNRMLYVDEVGAVCNGSLIPRYYHACLTRGREKGIGTLSATQRPRQIPQVIFSESEFFYIFRLSLDTDRAKVWESTGIEKERILALPKRYFFAHSFEKDLPPVPMKLRLNRKGVDMT